MTLYNDDNSRQLRGCRLAERTTRRRQTDSLESVVVGASAVVENADVVLPAVPYQQELAHLRAENAHLRTAQVSDILHLPERVGGSRIAGRGRLLRSLRSLVQRAERFARHRASTPDERAWAITSPMDWSES